MDLYSQTTLDRFYPQLFPKADIIAEQMLMYCFAHENIGTSLTQKQLAEHFHVSIGRINRSSQMLVRANLLGNRLQLTEEGRGLCQQRRPQRAILFADAPSWSTGENNPTLPCLLPIQDSNLIERLIRQLRLAGVPEILIVCGYHKETLEYLSERPGVRLIHNPHFRKGGTISSLYAARNYLEGAYVLPAHFYFTDSPFFPACLHSWLAVHDARSDEQFQVSTYRVTKSGTGEHAYASWHMAYFTREDAEAIRVQLNNLWDTPTGRSGAWERVLYHPCVFRIPVRFLSENKGTFCDTAESYLELQATFDQNQESAIAWAARQLQTTPNELEWESPLKKGMTNRTLVFRYRGNPYALRVPGAGSERLLNRDEENSVYRAISRWQYAETVIAFDKHTGRKLSRFLPDVRNCDANQPEDLTRALKVLRDLHGQALHVRHRFDCFQKIEQYRALCASHPSPFRRQNEVYAQLLQIQGWLKQLPKQEVLCHMDFHPDNLLFDTNGEGSTLIDWEYAGMQDPLFDLAMFALYSGLSHEQIDALVEEYFSLGGEICPRWKRIRYYAYIACGGFLWNLWCQYKSLLGIEFGSYWQQQYQYAKTYAKLVLDALPELEATRTHNAVILAAGSSTRFVPYSLERPKALWPFRGEILLERQIRQLREAGIQEILLVTGHHAEAYEQLAQTYQLECVYNPHYAERNNISSLACVIDRLKNTYICSADHYFETNPFEPYVEKPYYATVQMVGKTEEWCVSTDGTGRIVDLCVGGENQPVLYGHARIDEAFAQMFCRPLLAASENPECYGWYWEDVWRSCLPTLNLHAKSYPREQIQEFDSLGDLLQCEPGYWEETPCPLFDSACTRSGLDRCSCHDFQPIRSGEPAELVGCRFRSGSTWYSAYLQEGTEPALGFQMELEGQIS